jgi:hypothetical protein
MGLVQQRGKMLLRLDYETPTGDYASLQFKGVQAIKFTSWRSCTKDQVRAYESDRLRVGTKEDRLLRFQLLYCGDQSQSWIDELDVWERSSRRRR